jgi:hypothetical protein
VQTVRFNAAPATSEFRIDGNDRHRPHSLH